MTVYSSYPIVTTTTVDCEKQVRSWRLIHSILTLLIPTCNCINSTTQENNNQENKYVKLKKPSSTTITGTLYGSRRGKVNFCVQANPNSGSPILLLLELAIPTSVLAKEMKGGSMRIAFEESTCGVEQRSLNIFSVSSWTMYCNGKKVGFATKKTPSRFDVEILSQIETISVGAGITGWLEHEVVYLRGKFERFRGSMNSESFHLIDNDHGNVVGQELSFYFLRSR